VTDFSGEAVTDFSGEVAANTLAAVCAWVAPMDVRTHSCLGAATARVACELAPPPECG
jgi:hypothetical protein